MRIYENTHKTSENRLPQRSHYIPTGNSEYILLNGEWNFAYFEDESDVPEKITDWNTISVPSCWQLKGYDSPNYTNISYPFPCDPPYVPDQNPCGVYQRSFNIKELWGKLYFMFEGVATCAFLWINGQYVGFTQGSHLQSEFDITPYVFVGENTVTVKVLKWCCGSYLEDQDIFRFNGIFRDCYILQRPKDHFVDVCIKAENNCVYVNVDKCVDVYLHDQNGNLIGRVHNTKNAEFYVEKPVLWNAEKPYLYTVKVERNGECATFRTAFRTIQISKDYELLINGVSVKLFGVNHHDTHPENGWCQTVDELRHDLELMKQLNINCVRTSHYPPIPQFLDMCDELGFYVILETDIETHGIMRRLPNVCYGYDVEDPIWPCVDPIWKDEYVERMKRAALRDRNHPSIIMWSTGNESGFGPNSVESLSWLKSLNDGRLLHCEDASRKGDLEAVDVYSWMYPTPQKLEEFALDESKNCPCFLCEYAHAMGNGPGGIFDYIDLFDKYPKLIGGCIWEWADHTVIVYGVQKYGGDFKGELTHDYNFCCDGMVFSDRSFKAGTYEIKAAYQPIKTHFENGVLSVYNRYDFTNLSVGDFKYSIECDGKIIFENTVKLDLEPHCNTQLSVDIPNVECYCGLYLKCEFLRDGKSVAHTQHEIAVELKTENALPLISPQSDEKNIYFKGEDFEYTVSKKGGCFTSIKINGEEKIASNNSISAWRAPTDNDRNIKVYWGSVNIWQGENLDKTFSKVYKCDICDNIVIFEGSLAGVSRLPFFRYMLQISVQINGKIDMKLAGNIRKDAKYLPRLGFEWVLPDDADKFEYYGSGPYESYCDMDHGTSVGLYKSDADSEYVNYVRPQEHGNHNKVKFIEIGGLRFVAKNQMEINVSKFDIASLDLAEHTDELISDGKIHLRTDYKVSGLGSNSCGPLPPENMQLCEKEIEFEMSVEPIKFGK